MANFILLTFVCVVSLVESKGWNNAYIQNVESGNCVTVGTDKLLDPLVTEPCECGPYQYWRLEDGEHVINELAFYPYMDELYGFPQDGKTVGIYALTGSAWQKWRVREKKDGTSVFVNQHNSGKCLQEDSSGKLVQWECDEDDASQKWKIVQNPCGKPPKQPHDRFQLQNPATGMCAVILDNSNAAWAKVVTHKCSCENNYQYWKQNKMMMITEGLTKQCFANWSKLGHPGITQCGCVDDAIHRWRYQGRPEEDTFNLVSVVDGRCVKVDGDDQNTPLEYDDCDQNDPEQVWQFYDQCHPEKHQRKPAPPTVHVTETVTNHIPGHMDYYFESGGMNWFNPTRYTLLQGGRWDAGSQIWYTADGREIRPGTPQWEIYFGDSVKSSFLNTLFPGGKSFNDTFGWMNHDFFNTWTDWKSGGGGSQTVNVIPGNIKNFFDAGNMNWLNPTRYTLLQGGRWDGGSQTWYTSDGRQIRPGTSEWQIYFGDLQPSFLSVLFNGGRSSWSDVFGWMTPDFFTSWTSYKFQPTVQYVYDPPEIEYVYDPPTVVYQN